LIQDHWSSKHKGKLDFHYFTVGQAAAAMRIVLWDMIPQEVKLSSSSNSSHVHDVKRDLHVITGHAMNREDKAGSVLQPYIINMLKKQNIECVVNPNNIGRLVATSNQLQQFVARSTQAR
jgi:hypothetical protein